MKNNCCYRHCHRCYILLSQSTCCVGLLHTNTLLCSYRWHKSQARTYEAPVLILVTDNSNYKVGKGKASMYRTNFHRICEARTQGNSLNVGLRAGYLSVRMAGVASDRRRLKARLTNSLTYLLTYLLSSFNIIRKCERNERHSKYRTLQLCRKI